MRTRTSGAELLSSIDTLRLIFDNIGDAIIIHGHDGVFLDVNKVACDRLGYSREEMLGMTPADIDATDWSPHVAERLGELREKGQVRFETIHMTKDGRRLPCEICLRLIDIGSESVSVSIARDISERKRIENELRQTQASLERRIEERTAELIASNRKLFDAKQEKKLILDSINEFVLFFDKDLNLKWRNKAFKEAAPDVERDLAAGKKCHLALKGLEAPCEDCPLTRCMESGGMETGLKRTRGGRLWSLRCFPARDDAGAVVGAVFVARDVTESEKLKEQALSSQKMQAIGAMAGGVAHEFNNILAIISGYAELGLEEAPVGAPLYEELRAIFTTAKRARDIVKQMLTFSRGDDMPRAPMAMAPVIEEGVRFLRASLSSRVGIDLRLPAGPVRVRANPTQIQQVLINLCKNAADAMNPWGGDVVVVLGTRIIREDSLFDLPPGEYASLSVRDGGCGIPRALVDRIFEPFFSTKPPGKGTGMGLPVVLGIVKGLDGDVIVGSILGKGSTFEVLVPICRDAEKPIPVQQPGRSVGPRKGVRILYVDDEELILTLAARMLEALGHEVVTENCPQTALALFAATPQDFGLVVSDQAMPGMSGADFLREVRRVRPDVPVLLCTGYSENLLRDEHPGVDAPVLVKPITRGSLTLAVQQALKSAVASPEQAAS